MANCKRCGSTISWSQENGKWIPMEPDGKTRHRCQGSDQGSSNQGSSSGTKQCKYCNAVITWKEIDGKWVPHGTDGQPHRCRQRQ